VSAETVPPWMGALSAESRDAVRRIVAEAPALTDRQRERLRLLFRSSTSESASA
jgi:hypothetical protein